MVEIETSRFEGRAANPTRAPRDTPSEFEAFRAQMAGFERRLIRLMFLLWIGQICVLLGVLFAFFRS